MKHEIIRFNDPALRATPVSASGFSVAELTELVLDLKDSIGTGLGLAAHQIGRPVRVCLITIGVVDGKAPDFLWRLDGRPMPYEKLMPLVLCDPQISISPGTKRVGGDEGCLSFPRFLGWVARPSYLTVTYFDLAGARHKLECTKLLARVIEHEVDHTRGVLFIDRMNKQFLTAIQPRLDRIARGEDEPAEVVAQVP